MIDLKAITFFDRKAVRSAVDRATRRALSRFGAFVRRSAKSGLRRARQKKLSEMSETERARYEREKAEARREGRPRPRRPEIVSEPGERPKLHARRSPLKRLIYFGYDRRRQAVVIGPLPFGPRAADKLEWGRGGYEARPFMRPAFGEELPKLPQMWRDSVRSS